MEAVARSDSGVIRLRWRDRLEDPRVLGRLMIGPAVLFITALVGLPLLLAIWLSFTDATAGSLSGRFIGWENFTRELRNPIFQRSVRNTFIFTIVSQVLVLVLAKVLANFLVRQFRGRWILRALILLPWAAPITLGAIGWKWILDSLYSVLNWTLRALHILGPGAAPQWLGEPGLAMASIIAVHTWRLLPFAAVILLAGLSSIPPDVEDAAKVDGAVGWRRMAYVTIPMILPVIMVAALFGIVFTATDMTIVYVLTKGGPFNSTHVIASWAFQTGILSSSLGAGAAISLYLFPLLVVVSVVMLRFARRAEVGV